MPPAAEEGGHQEGARQEAERRRNEEDGQNEGPKAGQLYGARAARGRGGGQQEPHHAASLTPLSGRLRTASWGCGVCGCWCGKGCCNCGERVDELLPQYELGEAAVPYAEISIRQAISLRPALVQLVRQVLGEAG
jgi:hypothetical protein